MLQKRVFRARFAARNLTGFVGFILLLMSGLLVASGVPITVTESMILGTVYLIVEVLLLLDVTLTWYGRKHYFTARGFRAMLWRASEVVAGVLLMVLFLVTPVLWVFGWRADGETRIFLFIIPAVTGVFWLSSSLYKIGSK